MVACVFWRGFRAFGWTLGNVAVHIGVSTPNYSNHFWAQMGSRGRQGGHVWSTFGWEISLDQKYSSEHCEPTAQSRAGILLRVARRHTNVVACAFWRGFRALGGAPSPLWTPPARPPSPLDSSSGAHPPDVLRIPSSNSLVQPGIIVYIWLDQKYSKRSWRRPAAVRTGKSVRTLWSHAYDITWLFSAPFYTFSGPFAQNESDFCWSSAYYSRIFYSKTVPRARCCLGHSRTGKR